ncbi:hypothetical protein L0F63_006016 [Massospora cicadina]|nr:hypothetical protein L0F63_006016 [Massospora cicadina]
MKGDGLTFPVTQYADEGTLVWPSAEYSRDSGRKKQTHSLYELNSDEPATKPYNYAGPLGNRINRSSYTSFIGTDDDSSGEISRFAEASEDEESDLRLDDFPAKSGIKLRSGGYTRLSAQQDT